MLTGAVSSYERQVFDAALHNSIAPTLRPATGIKMTEPTYPALKPFEVGIRARCPRCGRGHLFRGFLSLAPRCDICGLDYSFADPADGPAFFVISIVSFPVIAFAAWLELTYEPPIWVHLLTSVPLLIGGCLALLRPLKGWLVASQYINDAREAGIAGRPTNDDRSRGAESQQGR